MTSTSSSATAIKDHYESLLSHHYSWAFQGLDTKIAEFTDFFVNHKVVPEQSTADSIKSVALDLGCGSGFQSIPLALLGYRVVGIDVSPTLIKEINDYRQSRKDLNLDITTIEGDITDSSLYPHPTSVVVCMGDTLPHLGSISDVSNVIRHSHNSLVNGGLLIVTFRDYTFELRGAARFIPVRSEKNRIFTCFLEYSSDGTTINVHDIVHTRDGDDAPWKQSVHVYQKLRLTMAAVMTTIKDIGFAVESSECVKGMVTIIAKKI